MSLYELPAEGKGYFHFERREAVAVNHFHSAPEFLFSETGGQIVSAYGEKRVLKKGEGCFFDSFTPHAYEKSDGAIAFVLLGEKGYFDRLFQIFGNQTPPRFFYFDDFALLETLRRFCEENGKNGRGREAIEEGAICVLLGALAGKTQFVDRVKDKKSELVQGILLYAEENLSGDLSLATLAKEFSYSPEHLSRALNARLGTNWTAYVNSLRARRAKRLLEQRREENVLKIAFDCGFESSNTFYRAYKKEFGAPPKRK